MRGYHQGGRDVRKMAIWGAGVVESEGVMNEDSISGECGKPVMPEDGVPMPTCTGPTVLVHKECVQDFMNRQAKAC